MTFHQSSRIIDVIFPLFDVEPDGADAKLIGTGFLVGSNNVALTAAHVLSGVADTRRMVAGFVAESGAWVGAEVVRAESHPNDDVACLQLDERESLNSYLRLAGTDERGSMPFEVWGYPEDVAYEKVRDGRVVLMPEPIFLSGSVRRRMTGTSIPGFRGSDFLELPTAGGACCSGAPVIKHTRPRDMWDVVGIYIGERITSLRGKPPEIVVGVAAYEGAFGTWQPSFLSSTIRDESRTGTLHDLI